MELIKEEKCETKYTLELTESELKTIICHFGIADCTKAKNLAKRKNYNILDTNRIDVLYEELANIVETSLPLD